MRNEINTNCEAVGSENPKQNRWIEEMFGRFLTGSDAVTVTAFIPLGRTSEDGGEWGPG